jgi:hypothetical protein
LSSGSILRKFEGGDPGRGIAALDPAQFSQDGRSGTKPPGNPVNCPL